MKKILLILYLFIYSSSFGQTYTVYQANFESTYDPVNFTSNGTNIWQVGTPQKPFFGTAQTPPNAIMTDTVNPYPVSNRSSFEIRNMEAWGQVHGINTLRFDHKYQTTSGHDGGTVEVSYDGINWQGFLVDTFFQNHTQCWPFPQVYNLYNSSNLLYNGEYGFSGTSNNWIHSEISWCWYLAATQEQNHTGGFPTPDSMFIRFTFYSDSVAESNAGWIIDNIYLTGEDPSGINEFSSEESLAISPNPSRGNFTVNRNGVLDIFNVLGEKVSQQTVISKNENIHCEALKPGIYFVSIRNGENIYQQKLIIN